MEVVRPHPNAVGQVEQVADGRGAQAVRTAGPDGQGVPRPRVEGQETVHDEGPPPILRVAARPVALAVTPALVGPSFPLVGVAGGRHAPQVVLNVAVRHRLAGLLRRPEVIVRGRARDVQTIGHEVAMHAP